MMFTITWQMTLVSLVLLPLSFILISFIIKKSQHYFKEQQDSLGEINGHVEEMYAGHNVMRVFNGEKRSVEKFKKINNKLYGSAWKSQFLSGLNDADYDFYRQSWVLSVCRFWAAIWRLMANCKLVIFRPLFNMLINLTSRLFKRRKLPMCCNQLPPQPNGSLNF